MTDEKTETGWRWLAPPPWQRISRWWHAQFHTNPKPPAQLRRYPQGRRDGDPSLALRVGVASHYTAMNGALIVGLLATGLLGQAAADEPGPAGAVDFERQIAPLLIKNCLRCHNGSDPAGKLDLSGRAAALKPGESGQAAIVPGHADRKLSARPAARWRNAAGRQGRSAGGRANRAAFGLDRSREPPGRPSGC